MIRRKGINANKHHIKKSKAPAPERDLDRAGDRHAGNFRKRKQM